MTKLQFSHIDDIYKNHLTFQELTLAGSKSLPILKCDVFSSARITQHCIVIVSKFLNVLE